MPLGPLTLVGPLTLAHVMVNVSDMTHSVAFYRDTLGLTLLFESPDWSEFDTGTTRLALHGGAAPGTRVCAPAGGTCSPAFRVKDLEATHAALVARGVFFIMPPTLREQEGIRLAVALDPDALPLSFSQAL